MNTRQLLAIVSLIVFISVGCTAVPNPTPTPQTLAGEGVTVVATRPLSTATMAATAVLTYATTPVLATPLSATVIPTPSLTPTPTIRPTFTSLPELNWNEQLTEIVTVQSSRTVAWSPAANQLVFAVDNCPYDKVWSETSRHIYITELPAFSPTDITPTDLVCGGIDYFDFLWHPEGQYFLMSALPKELFDMGDNVVWKINQNAPGSQETSLSGRYLEFAGWLDDTRFAHLEYSAGVNWDIGITDIETGENLASMYVHAGGVEALTTKYVIARHSDGIDPQGIYSVVVLSTEMINPEDAYNPYDKSLSFSNYHFQYVSEFDDVLPGTNQILVTTYDWETLPGGASEEIIKPEPGLHLWNPETDELTLLIPDGIYGRFSPNSHYLAYLTYDSNSHYLHLLDRNSGQIIFSQPVTSPGTEDKFRFDSRTSPYFSFSPNGRTLTFYSPTPELMLYDLETGEFLPPFTAVPYTPLWSPDSSRFVYQHPTDGLSIFDTRTNTAFPLATSGGERLSNPQWSYDGTYLSVTVQQEDGTRDTAVLQIP